MTTTTATNKRMNEKHYDNNNSNNHHQQQQHIFCLARCELGWVKEVAVVVDDLLKSMSLPFLTHTGAASSQEPAQDEAFITFVAVDWRFKFSVIFGVGTKKYRTSVVKDPAGNPDWNEESVIQVTNISDHVFFTVTEKDDVLGQIIIPVASLLTVKGVVKKSALKAHKKCPVPQGELIFQCYVSKQRPTMVAPQIRSSSGQLNSGGAQLTGFQKLKQNFSPTPSLVQQKKEEKEEKRKSSSLANFNKRLSKSIHDIFSLGKFGSGGNNEDEDDQKQLGGKNKRFSLKFPSLGSGLDSSGRDIPVVTHIVPNMASIQGGTRLVLEGQNLGLGKSDIMELLLCDTDLLDSIEFESESRIYVTTKATTPGKGDLWIETVSGGQNVIKNIFTFVDRSGSTTPVANKKLTSDPMGSVSSRGKNSALADSLAEKSPIPENKVFDLDTNLSQPSTPVERSISLNNEDRIKKKTPLSGSATLPRRFPRPTEDSFDLTDELSSSAQNSPTVRYKKNFMKHSRRASESTVEVSDETETKKNSEKAELQLEILRLHKENQELKQANADLTTYIDGLVARVMVHCPEALAAGDDLKPPPPRKK
ncbi:exocyst complex component 2 [Plakobranchus ocellatus]|uniref:Exocyst complex component 2 n=1 Tax=Plakobranchus ocellatus TaxID=259542 RepID=A0AAV3Z995_9GAST|nr:exocyst complex component 2 [Plakobranchus ocellatus]